MCYTYLHSGQINSLQRQSYIIYCLNCCSRILIHKPNHLLSSKRWNSLFLLMRWFYWIGRFHRLFSSTCLFCFYNFFQFARNFLFR
ncbi:hypothetical protein WQ54_07955 [Bacillus sp. SA1-12]|nr:hypothetical protein WQ54_07955 [Bacillus sp. SA1-12]